MGDVAALTWPLTRPGGEGPLPLPSRRARRCLFGPVHHEQAKKHLEEQMSKMLQKNKLRWNFDFASGRPLPPGQYDWEAVVDPTDADSDNGSESQDSDENCAKKERQTRITDFMRKRKSSSQKETVTVHPKTRRRSST